MQFFGVFKFVTTGSIICTVLFNLANNKTIELKYSKIIVIPTLSQIISNHYSSSSKKILNCIFYQTLTDKTQIKFGAFSV